MKEGVKFATWIRKEAKYLTSTTHQRFNSVESARTHAAANHSSPILASPSTTPKQGPRSIQRYLRKIARHSVSKWKGASSSTTTQLKKNASSCTVLVERRTPTQLRFSLVKSFVQVSNWSICASKTCILLSPVDCKVTRRTKNDTSDCCGMSKKWQLKEVFTVTTFGEHGGQDDCSGQTKVLDEGKCYLPCPPPVAGPISCENDSNKQISESQRNHNLISQQKRATAL